MLSLFDKLFVSLSFSLESGAGTISISVSFGLGHFLPDFLSTLVLLFLFNWDRLIVYFTGIVLLIPMLNFVAIMCQQVVVKGQLQTSFGYSCTL